MLLVLVAAGLARSPVRADTPLPAATLDPWGEVKTERFEITTQGDPARGRAIARHLERLAEALGATTRGFVVDGARPVRIVVFRDRASFRPYCPYRDDEFGNTVGFHVSGEDAEYIAVYGADDDPILRFVAHEYLHAVIARSFGPMPLWADEGLAEFYSTFTPRRDLVDIGRPIAEHVAWLRQHQAPVRDILLLSGESPDYRGGERRRTVYAQSWALVHGLALDPVDAGARFGRLLGRLSAGIDSRPAITAIYGANALDSLDADLRSRMTRMTLPYVENRFPTSIDDVPITLGAVDRTEALTRLGEMLAHEPDSLAPLARAHLEAAWASDSTRAIAAAWLGALAERAGDGALAARWEGRAVRVTPEDPRAVAVAGMAAARRRLSQGGPFVHPAPGATPASLEARGWLERATRAPTARSEWLVSYGITFLDDRTGFANGIGALLEARGALPHRSDVVGSLALLNVRAGNVGAALALDRQIPPGPERSWWRDRVAGLLVQEEGARAESLALGGRTAAAESLIVRVRDGLDDTWATNACNRWVDWIHEVEKHRAAAPPSPATAGSGGIAGSGGAAGSGSAAGSGGTAGGSAAPTGRGAGRSAAPRGLSPEARAESERSWAKAIATGAFGAAERIAGEMTKAAGSTRERAHADSLAAEARSRKAIESAEELLRFGAAGRACELLDAVLKDRPTAATRTLAERLRRQSCH